MNAKHPAFAHYAMATTFRITAAGADPARTAPAAQAAFAGLDRIEAELSRFQPASDVARLNRAPPGEWIRFGQDGFACLAAAQAAAAETAGAFDVTVGSPPAPGRAGWRDIELDRQQFRVRKAAAGVQVDLGGIGKGYALDRMAEILEEWDIRRILLDGGSSTVLAREGPPDGGGWRVGLGWAPEPVRLRLENRALSASGLAVKGAHIRDPRTGTAAARWERCWALAPAAAFADALSTAFMVSSWTEIHAGCARRPDVAAAVLENIDGCRRLRRIGPWPTEGETAP